MRSAATRLVALGVVVVLVAASCSTGTTPSGSLPDPPSPTTYDEVVELINRGQPTVVNVWASWCLPCRSEAPLLDAAAKARPDVAFVGLNVRDTPDGASRFIAEFLPTTPMTHLADPAGNIPVEFGGGRGVPITFFFARDGELVYTQRGVIDEPTFASYLDELSR